MKWLFALEMLGIAYLLWVVFVFSLVRSLKEIKKSSWHYKIWTKILGGSTEPRNKCVYGQLLVFAPFVGLFYGLWLIIKYVVCIPARLFHHWAILPFFIGRVVVPKRGKTYFGELTKLPEDRYYMMDSRSFMKLSPFVWFVVIGVVFGAAYQAYRMLFGYAARWEWYLAAGITAFVLLALFFIRRATRTALTGAIKQLKEKLCIFIPVVE